MACLVGPQRFDPTLLSFCGCLGICKHSLQCLLRQIPPIENYGVNSGRDPGINHGRAQALVPHEVQDGPDPEDAWRTSWTLGQRGARVADYTPAGTFGARWRMAPS